MRARTAVLLLSILMTGSCGLPDRSGCVLPLQSVATLTNSAISPLLSASIRHSRRAIHKGVTRPVPDKVREQLSPYFPEQTFDRVRWTVAADRPTLDTLIASIMPRYRAMTLDDTIVFMDEADIEDIGLWAHELFHVRQVRRAGGISKFSRKYVAAWAEIEAATVRKTNGVLAAINSPGRQSTPSWTRSCAHRP